METDKEYYAVDCHPYSIKTGDMVLYKDNKYYFQSNGNVGYLYSNYNDFSARHNYQHAVARTSVKKLVAVGETYVEPEQEQELVNGVSKLFQEVSLYDKRLQVDPSDEERAKELSAKRLQQQEKQLRPRTPPQPTQRYAHFLYGRATFSIDQKDVDMFLSYLSDIITVRDDEVRKRKLDELVEKHLLRFPNDEVVRRVLTGSSVLPGSELTCKRIWDNQSTVTLVASHKQGTSEVCKVGGSQWPRQVLILL